VPVTIRLALLIGAAVDTLWTHDAKNRSARRQGAAPGSRPINAVHLYHLVQRAEVHLVPSQQRT